MNFLLQVQVKVAQLCLTLGNPMDYTVHGILQARTREWVAVSFSRGSSDPGIQPRSPALQADSLPAEPQGKPKNTGVGSLSLLQQIFPTQDLIWGLLHCRRILSQLKLNIWGRCICSTSCTISLDINSLGLPWRCSGKESTCQCRRHGFHLWSGKTPSAGEQLSPCASTMEPTSLGALQRERLPQWEARDHS